MDMFTKRKTKRDYFKKTWHCDSGFSLIELITAIIIASILAGIIAQLIVSSTEINANINLRKTSIADSRYSAEMLTREFREWFAWDGQPGLSGITFTKIHRFQPWWSDDRFYYNFIDVDYEFSNGQLLYESNEGWGWSDPCLLIEGDVDSETSEFTVNTAGGITRVTVYINMSLYGKPVRIRTTTFSRNQ